MKSLYLAAIALLVMFASGAAMAQSPLDKQSTQEIAPLPVTSPPTIDGKLDDECWKNAPAATGFRLNNGKGLATHQTTAWVCYDADNLYIAFECVEPEAGKLNAHEIADDGPVWHDDCVEVFITPHAVATRDNFHHFAVNTLGCKAYLYAESPITKAAEWKAAASKSDGKWFVEMAIPFEILHPVGTNDAFWRIQFAREDLLHSESSSWSEVPQWYASPWRFGRLVQPASGPRFVRFRGDPKPIKSGGKAVGAKQLTPAAGDSGRNPLIIPEPRVARFPGGQFTITPKTRILIGKSGDPMDRRPAEEINEELQTVAGFSLPIEVVSSDTTAANCIIVGEPWLNPASDSFCRSNGIRVTREYPGKEGYALEVGKDSICVAGSDQAGTFWGAETLRQIIRRGMSGKTATVSCASIRDWPKFSYRGVHLLATPDALSFHGRMIDKILSRFKINNILLQAETIAWDSHPETARPDRAMSKEDVRKLIRIANDHHITVTPLIQALGHVNWAFNGGHNTEIAEDPKALYAYCPRNPKAWQFMSEITDEVIDLFGHPEYVHMGLDEFDMRGEFPYHEECKKIGKEQLYIDEIIRLHDYLKSRGRKMMMWGDILTKPGFAAKIGQVPKDILICDWRYGNRTDYPSLDFYKQNGFKVIGCTWYLPGNNYYFSKAAHDAGIEGMMKTTWTGFQLEDAVMKDQFHDLHSNILGAAWAWSPGTPKLDEMTYEPDQVFSQVWCAGKSSPVAAWYGTNLAPYCNVSLRDAREKIGWLGIGEGIDLSGLPTGVVTLGGVPFDLGGKHEAVLLGGMPGVMDGFGDKVIGIPVGVKANRLHFLSTTAFGDKDGRKVGEYVVHYADGSSEKVDIVYGVSILAWDAVRPASRVRSAWRGKTLAGDTIRVNTYSWENPHPEKVIQSIDLTSTGGQCAPVLIAVTAEVGGE
jgi:hexosaminidase